MKRKTTNKSYIRRAKGVILFVCGIIHVRLFIPIRAIVYSYVINIKYTKYTYGLLYKYM